MAKWPSITWYVAISPLQKNMVHFGLAKDDSVYKVIVIWPDEKTQELKNLAVNQVLTLNHKNATNQKFEIHPKYNPLMVNATQKAGC
jgi:hypothetical protein